MSKETNSAEVLLNQNVAPEQFDWDSFESGLNAEDRSEKKELEEIYNGSLNDLTDNDVITGKVVRLTDKEAIVDINFKSEGVISLNEFRYNPNLKVGDKVAVREKSKSLEAIDRSLAASSQVYEWITWNNDTKEGTFVSVPQRLQIPENIKEQLIVELYNK